MKIYNAEIIRLCDYTIPGLSCQVVGYTKDVNNIELNSEYDFFVVFYLEFQNMFIVSTERIYKNYDI